MISSDPERNDSSSPVPQPNDPEPTLAQLRGAYGNAMDQLEPKQQAFVEHYLDAMNGTQAAKAAGYAPNSAHVTASQLLTKPKVHAAVEAGRIMLMERAAISAEKVIRELADIAFVDPRNVLSWNSAGQVTMKSMDEISEADSHAIKTIETTRSGAKVTFHSKTKALEDLCRHLGLYAPEKRELSGPGGGPITAAVLLRNMSDDDLETLKRIAASARRVQSGDDSG